MEMQSNELICKCRNVTLSDIENALHRHASIESLEREFEEIQKETNCSTGCGGCHDRIMAVISQYISG